MTSLETVVLIFAVAMDSCFVVIGAVIIYAIFKFADFRHSIFEGVQDGDKITHQKDLREVLIMFFFVVFGIVDVNAILAMIGFGPSSEWYTVIGIITGIFLMLGGLKKIT